MKISTKIGQLFQLLIIALSLVGSNAWAITPDSVGVYHISTAEDLKAFASLVNGGTTSANAVLDADIVINKTIYNADGTLNTKLDNWTPIGTSSNAYTGTFNGNGFNVSGLYYSDENVEYVGLFGYISGATIDGVNLTDGYIYGKNYVGGICGYNRASSISNCSNGASVTGTNYVGGISGYNETFLNIVAKVSNDYNTGYVTGSDYVGGICGYNDKSFVGYIFKSCKSEVSACFNTGVVQSSGSHKGSICGSSEGTTSNNYYLAATNDDNGGKTAEQFANGEVAFLLQKVDKNWGQADDETHPSLAGGSSSTSPTLSSATNCKKETVYISGSLDTDGHLWLVGKINPATCTSMSYRRDSCKYCGVVNVDSLDAALGHDWMESQSTAATCTEDGTRTYVCGNDKSHTKSEVIPATGHSWDEGTITTAATCTEDGARTYVCGNDSSHTKSEVIPATGHSWDEGTITTAATCTKTGIRTYVCKNDSNHTQTEYVAIDPNAHSWNEGTITTAATCTKAGIRTYVCKNDSNHTQTEDVAIDPNAHSWDENSNGFCTACDAYEPAKVENDVYQITNAGNLYWFATLVNNNSDKAKASAILTDDIKVNADLTASGLRTWLPIGTEALPYKGTFDGNGKTISGLYYNGSDNNVGLFGYIQGANIRNVVMTDNSISGGNYVGSICGYNAAGIIVNCYNTSSVSGNSSVGGICGYNEGVPSGDDFSGGVYNCYNTGSVSVGESGTNIGGICGEYGNKATANCYSNTADSCAALKNVDNFKSGEVAVLLQMWADTSSYSDLKNWSQAYGTDSPVFGGSSIDYTRSIPKNVWGTLCLPYEFTVPNSDLSFYNVKGVENNTLVLSPAESIDAGTPVVYYYTGEDSLLKVSIDSSAFGTPATLTANNSLLYGVYENTTVKAADVANAYYLKEDKFLKINESFIANPFRAYIKTPATPGAPKASKSLALSLANNAFDDSDEEAATVTESHIVAIYNISGQQVGKMDRGGVYLVKMSDGSTKKVRITE